MPQNIKRKEVTENLENQVTTNVKSDDLIPMNMVANSLNDIARSSNSQSDDDLSSTFIFYKVLASQ
jgi:hypothetical protein